MQVVANGIYTCTTAFLQKTKLCSLNCYYKYSTIYKGMLLPCVCMPTRVMCLVTLVCVYMAKNWLFEALYHLKIFRWCNLLLCQKRICILYMAGNSFRKGNSKHDLLNRWMGYGFSENCITVSHASSTLQFLAPSF